MSNQTPTPETDAKCFYLCDDGLHLVVHVALARRLERERDEARRVADNALKDNEHLRAEVARMREDNTQMCAALAFIAQSPHCLSIFDARARAASSLAVGYGLVKTEALAAVREAEKGA
jgi:hypothetical protein